MLPISIFPLRGDFQLPCVGNNTVWSGMSILPWSSLHIVSPLNALGSPPLCCTRWAPIQIYEGAIFCAAFSLHHNDDLGISLYASLIYPLVGSPLTELAVLKPDARLLILCPTFCWTNKQSWYNFVGLGKMFDQLFRFNHSRTWLILTDHESSTWLPLSIWYLSLSSGSRWFQGDRHCQQNWTVGVATYHGQMVRVATSHGRVSHNLSINPVQFHCRISLLRLLHYQLSPKNMILNPNRCFLVRPKIVQLQHRRNERW